VSAAPAPGVWLRWLAAVAVTAVAQALFAQLAPHLNVPPVLGFIVASSMAGACLLAVAALAPPARARYAAWALLPAVLLVLIALTGSAASGIGAVVVVTVALLSGGTLVGTVVGQRIARPGHLLVVAWVSSLADIYSVVSSTGVSAQVVESDTLLSVLALSWPYPGTGDIVPLWGLGDVIMSAVYFSACRRHGLSRGRTAVALALALGVVLAVLLVIEQPLPVLPFMGLAVVVAHPRARRLAPEDRWQALIGMAVLTLAVAALFLLSP